MEDWDLQDEGWKNRLLWIIKRWTPWMCKNTIRYAPRHPSELVYGVACSTLAHSVINFCCRATKHSETQHNSVTQSPTIIKKWSYHCSPQTKITESELIKQMVYECHVNLLQGFYSIQDGDEQVTDFGDLDISKECWSFQF
jgi:hypothetical protein